MMLCSLFGHAPDRRRVWNDGYDFRAPCKRCGHPMLRDLHGWRLLDPAVDMAPGAPPRSGHPDHHAG